jgi:hypothetical protein
VGAIAAAIAVAVAGPVAVVMVTVAGPVAVLTVAGPVAVVAPAAAAAAADEQIQNTERTTARAHFQELGLTL